MAFAQNLRIFQKIMLAILSIWLCLFSENFSILTKTLILGQPPSKIAMQIGIRRNYLYKWKEQMAKKTLVHRGYHGSIEVNTDNFTLSGSILFIESDFKYEGETYEKLENNFIIQVEKHIANCDEKGVSVPFKEK